MYAQTMEDHQRLQQEANELVHAWAGTDPMRTMADVRGALKAMLVPGEELEEDLVPYVYAACKAHGLIKRN